MPIITVKIDVRKLDKARFFEGKADANGHKPLYADLVLIERREVGKYGDTHIVKQSVTKEEREKKVELPIIGNATERVGNAPAPQPANQPASQGTAPSEDVPW
jgi:hypothetical protein